MKTTQSDIEQRNTDVLEVLNMATPMLKRLAFQFNMEYDELHQMAAEAALLNYERAQEAEIPRAFLYGVVRNVLWYKPKEEPTLSLDAPCAPDSDTLLSDLVPASPLREVNLERRMRKERTLYASLRKLPLEVQHYLIRVHELYAYRPQHPKKGRFAGKRPNFSKDPGTLSRQAYHYLRRDKRLAHVICGTPLGYELDLERDYWAESGDEEATTTSFERDYWAESGTDVAYTRQEAASHLGVTEEEFDSIAHRYQVTASPNGMYPHRPIDLLTHTFHSSSILPSLHAHAPA